MSTTPSDPTGVRLGRVRDLVVGREVCAARSRGPGRGEDANEMLAGDTMNLGLV